MTAQIFWCLLLCQASWALDLNALRTGTLPPRQRPPLQPLPPEALPLCGNGVLNTAKDYEALQTYRSVWPNEECDDGNRLDYDGCSADCMHRDLWIPACELQMLQTVPHMEAITSAGGGDLLLSALDGLYLLKGEPAQGEAGVRATFLHPKNFAVSDLFHDARGRTLLYSTSTQTLWQWNGALSVGGLSIVRNISHLLRPWPSSRSTYIQEDDVLIAYDEHTLVGLNLTSDTILQGDAPICTVAVSLGPSWFPMGQFSSGVFLMAELQANKRLAVSFLAPACILDEQQLPTESKIWMDAFQRVVFSNLIMRFHPYSATYPAGFGEFPIPPNFMETYSPMGLWAEIPWMSIRALVSNVSDTIALAQYLSDLSMIEAVRDSSVDCMTDLCLFDMSPAFDILSGANFNLTGRWQDVLQGAIDNVTHGLHLADFNALYANATLYARVLDRWAAEFARIVGPRAIRDYAAHPRTRNTWVVRDDALFEIARSGVQVALPNGKCLPSAVALCPPCHWAPAGAACQPCASRSSNWAWSVQCGGCPTMGRRLLQAQTTTIEFVVVAADATALSDIVCVAQAQWRRVSERPITWNVTVSTADPVACMRDLRLALSVMHTPVPPRARANLPPPAPPPSDPAPVLAIVGGSVGALAIFILIAVALCLRMQKHPYKAVPAS